MNGKNSAELAAQPDVDGFLVGGASLKVQFTSLPPPISALFLIYTEMFYFSSLSLWTSSMPLP